MDFSKLLQIAQANLKEKDDVTKDAMKQSLDRIRMLSTSQQGPSLPESTPEGEALASNALSTATMGSTGKMPAIVGKELVAKNAADFVHNAASAGIGGMEEVALAQQKLSRAADMAKRTQDQLRQRKLNSLKSFIGR